jgi:hypothetical protein
MVRPTEIQPLEPTEELRLTDGRAGPIGDRAVETTGAGPAPAAARPEPAAAGSAVIGGGRASLVVGLVLGALVIAVAGAGVAGRAIGTGQETGTGEAVRDVRGADGAADPGAPDVAAGGPDAALGLDGGDDSTRGPGPGFPVEVDGLVVSSVERARREAGRDDTQPIAVAGWLSVERTLPTACVIWDPANDPALLGTGAAGEPPRPALPGLLKLDPRSREADFCRRAAVLRSSPDATWREPHLHPQFLPGLSLAALPEDPGGGVPVVLIGHFRDGRTLGCVPDGRNCGHELVVDRVAWADGRELPSSLAVSLPGPLNAPTRPPAGAGRIVELLGAVPVRAVSVAGVQGEDLHLLDPDAAAVVASSGAPPEIAWYVRFIVPDSVNGRVRWTVGWAVVDDATGEIVAQRLG